MHEIEQLGYSNCIHLTSGGEGDVYTCEKQGMKCIVKAVHGKKRIYRGIFLRSCEFLLCNRAAGCF